MKLEESPQGWRHPEDPGEPSNGNPRLSVAPDELALLQAFAAGRRCLEVGTGLGVSTRAMAEVAKSVATVDIDEWVHANVWPTLSAEVHKLTDTREITGRYDMVFVDGDHTAEAVEQDIATVLERIRPGGVAVFHDCIHRPGPVADTLDELLPGWVLIPTTHGLGVFVCS